MARQDKSMIAGASPPPGAGSMIAAGLVHALLMFAVARGAPQGALIERCGIDLRTLEDQDNRIPFAAYIALMRAGQDLAGDPALALHFGEACDLADVSIIGLIGQASETMDEALTQINRFHRLAADFQGELAEPLVVVREDGQLRLVDNRRLPGFPEFTEAFFARMVSSARRGIDIPLAKAVYFTHAEPAYRGEYDRIFRAPIVFGSAKNALALDDFWLTFRNPHAQRYAFGVFSERAEALLKKLEDARTVRGRVESLLMPILHTGEAGMEAIAVKMGLSPKTLFRKLKDEGVTFERVLDELRHRMALEYLDSRKVSVNETAYLVGFSDPASFSRAFKRWTGTSPRKRPT
jgi:AraC-like DNA-binding protein